MSYLVAGLHTAAWGIGVVLGGPTGGRLADRIDHRRAALGALVGSLVAFLELSLFRSPATAWSIVFGLAFGNYDMVYLATSMDVTDPRVAASMFAILTSVANIGTGVGFAVGGALVDGIGYRSAFVVIAALNLLALPLIPLVFRQREHVPAT